MRGCAGSQLTCPWKSRCWRTSPWQTCNPRTTQAGGGWDPREVRPLGTSRLPDLRPADLADPIQLQPDAPFFAIWAMLHQREVIALPFGLVAKTTYPVLPWIGIIALGYAISPWFLPGVATGTRQHRLAAVGVAMLVMFALLRLANGYGDKPWFVVDESAQRTAMSFFALTKYPPSLLFLLLTLGIGALLLVALERMGERPVIAALAVFGGAPLFFYLLHLTALRLLYSGAFAMWGATQGTLFGLSDYAWVLVWYAALIAPLYFPTA